MRQIFAILLLCVTALAQNQTVSGGTTSGNILPAVTGQDLGSTGQRWDAFLQTLDLAGNLNNVRYATGFSGSDIGAQINAAYADLPSSGGTIIIPQQSDGTCYSYSTPIVFSTLNKVVSLRADAPGTLGNAAKTAQTGTCINYTPTTSTAALSIDWGNTGGDTSYAASGGLFNIILINNQCVTNGGCSSSASGIEVGAANGGARGLVLADTSIMGFGKGIQFAAGDTGGVGWGFEMYRGSVAFNTTGISYEKSIGENDSYFGVKFITNGTHINIPTGGGGEFSIFGGSLDSASTCGISGSANVMLYGVHMENLGQSNVKYTCDPNSGLTLTVVGGIALDDTSGGSTSQDWFSASQTDVKGLRIYGGVGGRTYSGKIFNVGDVAHIQVENASPSAIPQATICNETAPCFVTNITHASSTGSTSTVPPLRFVEQANPSCTSGVDVVFGSSSLHRVASCDNNGSVHQYVKEGQDINTSDQVVAMHLSSPLPINQGGTASTTNILTPLYNISGTAQASSHMVKGSCTLGTDCAVTLSGSAIFTSNATYDCFTRDSTTPANAVTVALGSGSAVTFTGTGTDVIHYLCVGN